VSLYRHPHMCTAVDMCGGVSGSVHNYVQVSIQYRNPDRKKTPPGGVSYLPCSLIKNTEEEDLSRSLWYKFFEGGPLPPGS